MYTVHLLFMVKAIIIIFYDLQLNEIMKIINNNEML